MEDYKLKKLLTSAFQDAMSKKDSYKKNINTSSNQNTPNQTYIPPENKIQPQYMSTAFQRPPQTESAPSTPVENLQQNF